jgi:hypothetical protein
MNELVRLQSQEIRADRQQVGAQSFNTPWCNHKHSLVPKKIATTSLGGANALTCKGVLDNCPIAKELLADI